MSLIEACIALAETIDGALLCGVIEVTSGRVLALHSTDGNAAQFESAFAYSARELMQSPSEELLGDPSSEMPAHRLTEVQLTSTHTCHLAKSVGDGSRLLVLVTRKDTNVGMSWAELKSTATALAQES